MDTGDIAETYGLRCTDKGAQNIGPPAPTLKTSLFGIRH